MAKNQLAPKAPKHRSVEEILRDPSARAKLNNLVDEAVNCKTKIAYEQQNIKALKEAAGELGLHPKLFSSYVAMAFNNDYGKRKEDLEQQLTLVEVVMGEAGQLTNDE